MNDRQLKAFINLKLPRHMLGALERYIDDGINPGGFLSAVIENNLSEAVARADSMNIACLDRWVKWFYNYAPASCWGHAGAIASYRASLAAKEVV